MDFSGYKTYIVAAATIIYAVVSWWSGAMGQDAAIAMILGGAGIGALRHAVTTTVAKTVDAVAAAK